jgi:copper chaperone CopZ
VQGVGQVEADPKTHTATVTFEDTETDVKELREALWEKDFVVEGEPNLIE